MANEEALEAARPVRSQHLQQSYSCQWQDMESLGDKLDKAHGWGDG